MTVEVARGLGSRIREHRRGIVLQVQGASDPDAATTALSRARAEIAGLDGGWQSAPGLRPGDHNGPTYVGRVVPTPAGPFLYVDGGETPADLLATIPDIITGHLREAGVTTARIASPRPTDTPLFRQGPVLDRLPRAVVLHLYPRPGPMGTVPPVAPEWLDQAASWVAEEFDGGSGAWAQALSVVFPIERRDTREVFEQCRRAGIVQVVAGDLERRIRVLYAAFRGAPPAMAVAGGGPSATDEELLAAMEDLAEIGRRLAPGLGYAHISVQPTFSALRTGTWPGLPGGSIGYIEYLYDEIVLDAMPWQLLGPGHLRRLDAAGALPPDGGPGAQLRPCAGGMAELAVADPDAHEGALDDIRRLLAPCMPSEDERRTMLAARHRRRDAGS